MGLIMWDLQMVPAHTDECGRTEQTQLSDIDIDASLDMIGHMRSSLDILSRRVNDMRAPHSLTAEEYASLLNIRFNDAPEIRRNMSSAGQNRRNTGASSDRRDEYSHRDTHEDGVERRTGNTASSDRQVSISEYDHDSSVRISPTYPRTTDNDGPPELMSDSSQDSSSSDGMPALISFATPDMLARWMAMAIEAIEILLSVDRIKWSSPPVLVGIVMTHRSYTCFAEQHINGCVVHT
ncbi:hypothetical protein SARC_07892 [Sphaeroforma arctica JP610]|uniref:Uncharacterized protein n=1 Tax=Sphaeroforma arctica JP610 TaxID=667725 RepID=A0A0L0FSE1_9EUKA|nr:hypothetical protein SARC_07892 [Sphaeroforma arctica JP610]KNC79717.1 hypothetical protein SARC_07892 [Sphaeroforma arctica JP610]|eukprot:XP_014153619.1 hypothetical protein SARC_07892 [Sphaeroforma arctica JP610]